MTKEELYKVTDILNDVLSNYLRGSEAEEVIAKLEESVEDSELFKEEPVSEKFEKALAEEWKGYNERGAALVDALEDNTQELAFAKGFYRGANWQKQKDKRLFRELLEIANQEDGCLALENLQLRLSELINNP